MTRRRYRGFAAVWWGAGLLAAGSVAIGLAWRGANATPFVPTQLAFAVSGGLGGLLLVVIGLSLLRTQLTRIVVAEHVHRRERLLDALDHVNDALRSHQDPP